MIKNNKLSAQGNSQYDGLSPQGEENVKNFNRDV